MKQLVQPNLSTVGNIGYCLAMQENVWGTPHLYDTAWNAWQATQYKHTDPLPEDVCVPVWFSYWENGTNYGHVATNVPGRGVLSSPYKANGTQQWFTSIDQCASVLNCTYVGWSEDIATVRVTEEVLPMGVTIDGAPASTSDANNITHVFAKGSDGQLWHKYYDENTSPGWHAWEALPGGGIASAPSACSSAQGRMDVFASNGSGALLHWYYVDSDKPGWHGPENMGQPQA